MARRAVAWFPVDSASRLHAWPCRVKTVRGLHPKIFLCHPFWRRLGSKAIARRKSRTRQFTRSQVAASTPSGSPAGANRDRYSLVGTRGPTRGGLRAYRLHSSQIRRLLRSDRHGKSIAQSWSRPRQLWEQLSHSSGIGTQRHRADVSKNGYPRQRSRLRADRQYSQKPVGSPGRLKRLLEAVQKASGMRKVFLLLLLLAVWAQAEPVTSGLKVGQRAPAHHPFHVTGPDAGTDTCPV